MVMWGGTPQPELGWTEDLPVEGVGGRGGSPHALHHLDTVLCQWRQAQFRPLLYFESLQMLKSTEGKLRFEQETGREERKKLDIYTPVPNTQLIHPTTVCPELGKNT